MGCTNCYSGYMWWVLVWVGFKGFVMGRVIKFRGYDEENKTWRYGFYYKGTNGGARIASYIIADDGLMYYIHSEKSIGQFTGLADKNGVEVYEGGIVDDKFDCGQLFTISYDDKRACFIGTDILKEPIYSNTRRFVRDLSIYPEATTIGLVIGNIHQNPELLK